MTRTEQEQKLPYTIHETKYLKFVVVHFKPKTKVFTVVSKRSDEELGVIEWYSKWRQYCFMPYGNTVWNPVCLQDIQNFINTIMIGRKPKPKTIGVICRDQHDFLIWSRKKKHRKKSATVRKYIAGTTTYIALSTINHCCGLRLDKIVETDMAQRNCVYHQMIEHSKACLKK